MAIESYESPNILSLFYQYYEDSEWSRYLQHWEDIIFSLVIACCIALLFFFGTRKKQLIPSGLQNALEYFMEFLEKMTQEILGTQSEKYLPFLGTVFVYILTMNLWGLLPFMKSPTSNLSITLSLGLSVFAYVQYLSIRTMGLFGYLYHLAGAPKSLVAWLIVPLILPIEILTQITRPLTLALRLCGNMMGEHILIVVFAIMGIVWLETLAFPLAIPLQTPIIFLALLMGFMQALVFTVLTSIYIFLSIPQKH